jgi:predicted dehydrogenase
VTGTVNRRAHEGVSTSDVVEEGAAMLLQFSNGVVGTFVMCDNVASPYAWDVATGENPLYPKPEGCVDSYRIFGSDGTLSVPDSVEWTYEPGEAKKRGLEMGWNVPITRENLTVANMPPFQGQTEHLGRVCRGMEEPRCSGEDGLAAVKVCEAVIYALEAGDGTPVNIEHFHHMASRSNL